MTPFPKDKLAALMKAIDHVVNTTPGPHFAAFDADGTLWNTDLGETLFKYQIKNSLVPLPPNAYDHYEHLKANVSHEVAYLWLAQINKGLPLTTVQEWAETSVQEISPVPIFSSQQQLIRHLLSRNVQVYIVTASIKWAVEPGAKFFDLSRDNVIGIRTAVDAQGLITETQEGPITWRKGKVEGLMKATGGRAPIFASGNTEGDLALLECATHLRLTMAANPPSNDNYETERNLLKLAQERGWFFHDFRGE